MTSMASSSSKGVRAIGSLAKASFRAVQPVASCSRVRLPPPPSRVQRRWASSSTAEVQEPYYVTTPIFYVNASPHIGHLHTLVLTDVLARYSRLRYPDRPVLFATGTDEHGLKIQQAAAKAGISEQEFCDTVSKLFRNLADAANISHTTFIRTTEERHRSAVEHFWAKLVDSGDVYKGTHSGWYSVSDECFFAPSQVSEVDGKMIATETGNEVILEEETNWKFRLGKWRDRLKEWASNPTSIQPEAYRLEVLRQIEALEDLSVSRPTSRVKWGVPVPGDPEQTVYVWVDALINYITVLGYPQSETGWPADVQVVGKDILKFHAIHWPALLFSAGLQPPRTVLAHAHWTMAKSKMSKSRGNVVNPHEAMSKWGVDGVRWFLMRAGGALPDDADWSEESIGAQYSLLSNQIGNLTNRLYTRKVLARVREWQPEHRDAEFDGLLGAAAETWARQMEGYQMTKACEGIMGIAQSANQLFTDLQPWNKDPNTDPTKAIIYAYHALRISAILLQPVMPSKASELLDRLGVPAEERSWEHTVWRSDSQPDTAKVVQALLKGKDSHKGYLFPSKDDVRDKRVSEASGKPKA